MARLTLAQRWVLAAAIAVSWWVLPPGQTDVWMAMPALLPAVIYAAAAIAKFIAWPQALIMIGITVYGAVSQKEAARRARNTARDTYNASLQDRAASVMSTQAPLQIIHGEAVVGGVIVAVLTSGDKDQYKHLVVVWAGHECDAITDFFISGISVGGRDSSGSVLGGKYNQSETNTYTVTGVVSAGGQVSIGGIGAVRVLSLTDAAQPLNWLAGSECTIVGTNVQISAGAIPQWVGRTVRVTVDSLESTSRLRVRHFLGTDTQLADAMTRAECPDWLSTDRLQGLCYSIVRLDLNEQEFQGGPPQMSARIRGRKVYDYRTGVTAWSDNNALCVADFLRAPWGKSASASQLVQASIISAANACDELLTLQPGAKRYTCNGAFRTDQNPDGTLTELCQSMAGFVTYSGAWHVQAGVYTEPVMDLGDAENMGSVEGVAGVSDLESFNSLRGQFFDPARYDQLTDYTPYQNAAMVAADEVEHWASLNLPFTNAGWRATNLARIHVERSRGQQWVVPMKRVALKALVGQRIRFSNSLLGISASVFRVVKREYTLGAAVKVTLAQDAATWYDEIDDPGVLESPSGHQPDVFTVARVEHLLARSGNATLIAMADGTIVSRIKVTFDASSDALVRSSGALQLEYRRDADTVWQRVPEAAGGATETWLSGLKEREVYVIRVRWRNGIGATSDWASTTVLHLGKSEPPSQATNFEVDATSDGAAMTWDPCPDIDYLFTSIYLGDDFDSAVMIWRGVDTSNTWPNPEPGSFTLWIQHTDTSKNVSDPVSVTADLIELGVAGRLTLRASGQVFATTTAGAPRPLQLTFKAVGFVSADALTWEVRDGTATLAGTGDTRTLAYDDLATDSATIRVSEGDVYDETSIVKLRDGAGAINLLLSNQVHSLPAAANGAVTSYAGASTTAKLFLGAVDDTANWTFSIASSAGVTAVLTAPGGVPTVTVTGLTPDVGYVDVSAARTGFASPPPARFSLVKAKAGAQGEQGDPGPAGTQYASPTVYAWGPSIPAGPTGSATWNWASQSFGSAPSGWSLSPGSSPSAGFTLWGATVPVSALASAATTNFNWTSASITARGAAGSTGSVGAQGASYRMGYARIAVSSIPGSGFVQTAGSTSFPTAAQSLDKWGVSVSWSSSDPNPSSTISLYVIDGFYDPATTLTTWATPFQASLKVAILSAITANMGSITAGEMNIGGGRFVVASDGAVTAQSSAAGARLLLNTSAAALQVHASSGAVRVRISA